MRTSCFTCSGNAAAAHLLYVYVMSCVWRGGFKNRKVSSQCMCACACQCQMQVDPDLTRPHK
jgi:hypothetical protein